MSYSVTLYFYPSPQGVDWRSPYHLTKSVIRNALTFRPRTIGHVSVLLEGNGERIFTGMSHQDPNDNRKLILFKMMGLGVLFHQVPGYAESKEKLDPELEKRLDSGDFSFIRFQISEPNYQKLKNYLHEYFEKNIAKWYGLPHRPRHEEGSGCSAFAASVLEVAGLMTPDFKKNWSGTVKVPDQFIGDLNQKKVPIWKLIFPHVSNQRWAEPHEPGREIFFWDPDMMHAWTLKTWSDLQIKPSENFKAVRERNTKGVLVDSSKILPTSEPIWLR